MEKKTKTCPYCGGEILEVAKKCKHCGHWLNDNQPKVEEALKVETKPTTSPTPKPKKPMSKFEICVFFGIPGAIILGILIISLIMTFSDSGSQSSYSPEEDNSWVDEVVPAVEISEADGW